MLQTTIVVLLVVVIGIATTQVCQLYFNFLPHLQFISDNDCISSAEGSNCMTVNVSQAKRCRRCKSDCGCPAQHYCALDTAFVCTKTIC